MIPGYSGKRRDGPAAGGLRILQARDLSPDGGITWQHLDHCEAKPGSERARLRDGDLLLAVRSADPRAIVVRDPPADVVAGGPFAILRCRPDAIDAAFLFWLLNADGTRQRLRAALRGSAMPFLGIADLKNLELPIPALPTQRAIARVQMLRCRMSVLAARLDRALGQLLEAVAHSPRS